MSYKFSNKYLFLILLNCIMFSSISIVAQVDTIPNIIKSWKISNNNFDIDSIKFDTSLINIQKSNIAFLDDFIPSWLGNYGLASRINLSNYSINMHFPYIQAIKYNTFTHSNNAYFNTRKPITQIDYYNGGGKSSKYQFVNIFHTQNINPFFNSGIRIRYLSALGDYAKQEFRSTSFGMWSSYRKKDYYIYADLNYNKLKNLENGGFENDSIFDNNSFSDPHFISTALNDAKSINRISELNINQGWSILLDRNYEPDTLVYLKSPNRISLVHNVNVKSNSRVYLDNNPTDGFYSNIFLDSITTYDSSAYTTLHNSLYLEYIFKQNIPIKLNGGLSNYLEKKYCGVKDTITSSVGGFARVKGTLKNTIQWNMFGRIYFSGYYRGDYNFEGNFRKVLTNDTLGVILSGSLVFKRNTPSWFYSNYSSNNFKWNHQLLPVSVNQIDGKIEWQKYKLSMQIRSGLFYNYLYFNENAYPSQLTSKFYFVSLLLKKELHIRNFRFSNKILIQGLSRNDIIDIPVISYSSSLYYQSFLLNKILFAQIGLDAYYQSSYYAPAYMPSTGIFYSQDNKRIGNYPFIDVFLNVKLKQVRFTFKYEHVNIGYGGNNYFSAYHYVAPQRRFTFGLKWFFYN